jgi:hypothetical protein
MSEKIYCEVIGYTILPLNKIQKHKHIDVFKIRRSKLRVCGFNKKYGVWCSRKAKWQVEIYNQYNYYFVARLCTYHKNMLLKFLTFGSD